MTKKGSTWPWIAVILALVVFWHQSSQPKRPFLHWLGNTISGALKVAPLIPLFLDEGPDAPNYQSDAHYVYNAGMARAVDTSGEALIEHGEGW